MLQESLPREDRNKISPPYQSPQKCTLDMSLMDFHSENGGVVTYKRNEDPQTATLESLNRGWMMASS